MRIQLPGNRTLVLVVRSEKQEKHLAEVILLGTREKFFNEGLRKIGLEREGWDIPPAA